MNNAKQREIIEREFAALGFSLIYWNTKDSANGADCFVKKGNGKPLSVEVKRVRRKTDGTSECEPVSRENEGGDVKKEKNFFSALIVWCLEWGCDVQFRGAQVRSNFQGTYVESPVFPEAVFTKGDKRMSIKSSSWEELERSIYYSQQRIFNDFCLPELKLEKEE